MRELAELIDVDEPAWPLVDDLIAGSNGRAQVLPVERGSGELCLYRLQVTVRSVLGALALNCGGVLVDDGWLVLLGGGHPPLPDLATANGLVGDRAESPAKLEVGRDVLGGIFAVNGGGLAGSVGNVHYFAPDTLEWQDLGLGHGALVAWAMSDAVDAFYADLRWPGWRDEISSIPLGHALSVYPPLFTTEGQERSGTSRRPVPWDELRAFNEDMRRQLEDIPPGGSVRFRIDRGDAL
jgi:hypothetical protein